MNLFKGPRCLKSGELVYEKRLKPFFFIDAYGLKDVLKVECKRSQICMVFLTS